MTCPTGESWLLETVSRDTYIKNQVWIRLKTSFSKVELRGSWILLGELKLMSETNYVTVQSGSISPALKRLL